MYRVAISNRRIVVVNRQGVTYRFTPSGTKQSVTRNISGEEFVRGFLQHTLPSKLQRIRLQLGFAELQTEVSMTENRRQPHSRQSCEATDRNLISPKKLNAFKRRITMLIVVVANCSFANLAA